MIGSNSNGPVGAAYNPGDNLHKGMAADPPRQSNMEVEALKAEIRHLRTILRSIDELFGEAVQDDCENGVKWLNERASSKYLAEYPHTRAAISFSHKAIRAALGEE